MRDNKPAKTVR